MTWIKQVVTHECAMPPRSDTPKARTAPGSVWRCDSCGAYWKAAQPGAYEPEWQRMSNRRGRRLERREGLRQGVR